MVGDPLARGRAGTVGGRLHDRPGEAFARPRAGEGVFQLEDLTTVDRERLHFHQRFTWRRVRDADTGQFDQRFRSASGNESLHRDPPCERGRCGHIGQT